MTAQIHERLIYEGAEHGMAACPAIPRDHPRIRKLREREAVQADEEAAWLFSTACWRRYLGTWKIEDGRFYLVSVRGIYHLDGEEPLLADWFSGTLRIPQGERLQYVHMGFASVYERDLLIRIEAGVVVATEIIDNRPREPDQGDLA